MKEHITDKVMCSFLLSLIIAETTKKDAYSLGVLFYSSNFFLTKIKKRVYVLAQRPKTHCALDYHVHTHLTSTSCAS